MSKTTKYYQLEDERWQRIHFIRPRFKANIENVLLYMANECCKIPTCSCAEYSKRYLDAIRLFPGNIGLAEKTLQNWRTETPALFGFYTEDKLSDVTTTSRMATFLNENQDLTQFLRLFLRTFQFPGGHLKPNENIPLIKKGIRFKPAQWIVRVLLAGNELLAGSGKEMSISGLEATYCIFNDVFVTSGVLTPREVAQTILYNRENKIKYYNKKDPRIQSRTGKPMSLGDVKRYAQDILDYMELASILEEHNGFFYLKPNEVKVIAYFKEDNLFFDGYESFYSEQGYTTADIARVEVDWFDYVNSNLDENLFQTDISSLLDGKNEIDVVVIDRIQSLLDNGDKTTKDIGNLGEALICGHEKMRLKIAGYDHLAKLVQVVDSPSYHPGFDIDSFEGDGSNRHRYIEVKTTISKQKLQLYAFHMSPNEWSVAETHREHYCVYRLMLSQNSQVLYILRNPVSLYKTDQISAMPRNGMEISFSPSIVEPTPLLTWRD